MSWCGPKLSAQWLMYPTVSNKMDTESWKELGEREFPSRAVNLGVIQAYVPQGTSPYAPLVAPLWATPQGQHHGFIQFFKDKKRNSGGETALDEDVPFLRGAFRLP